MKITATHALCGCAEASSDKGRKAVGARGLAGIINYWQQNQTPKAARISSFTYAVRALITTSKAAVKSTRVCLIMLINHW